jgi:hypothetical protein
VWGCTGAKLLKQETTERHRANVSLGEELKRSTGTISA